MSDSFGYGHLRPEDASAELNAYAAIVRQMVAKLDTMKLVQVMAVHGGGIGPTGTVDVMPLVNQIDGNGNAVPHRTVNGIAWSRVQGGANAVICDPVVGDIGWVVAADRDITNVKKTGKQSTPPSWRQFAIEDGVYAGACCMQVTPNQFLIFTATGVRLVDKNGNSIELKAGGEIDLTTPTCSGKFSSLGIVLAFGANNVTVDGTGIHLNGPTFFNGVASGPTAGGTIDLGAASLTTTGSLTGGTDVSGGGKSLKTHTHPVTTAPGTTGPPV